jgi:nucleoid-associated protein YgaU
VKSARHAVAIDENRRAFEPTLWDNVDELNGAAGMDSAAPDAPYQQKWFPGVHNAVGGSGQMRGLSDQTLEWVWAGARLAGLELDTSESSRVYSLRPDFNDPLDTLPPRKKGMLARAGYHVWRRKPRAGGPTELHQVSIAARRRWHAAPEALPEGVQYRPPPLEAVAAALDADSEYRNPAPIPPPGTFDVIVVKQGDTLGKIAKERLGAARRYPEIFEMNRDKLGDPNRIYCGMTLRVPRS